MSNVIIIPLGLAQHRAAHLHPTRTRLQSQVKRLGAILLTRSRTERAYWLGELINLLEDPARERLQRRLAQLCRA